MRVTKVACGSAHNAAVAVDLLEESKGKDQTVRQLFTWGLGSENRLGHGTNDNKSVPTRVDFFAGNDVEDVACGLMNTAVIVTGKLFTFGCNEFGQLGTGDKKNRDVPFCVSTKTLQGAGSVLQVACGGYHTVCVCEDNNVYSWGGNESGINM